MHAVFSGACSFRAAAEACVARPFESASAAGEAAIAAAMFLCGEDMRAAAAAPHAPARATLDRELPFDAHARCTGRLAVTLVSLRAWRTVVVFFATRDDLIDVLVASAHVPFLTNGRAWEHAKLRRCCAYLWTPVVAAEKKTAPQASQEKTKTGSR
jgi:hypothetical protein